MSMKHERPAALITFVQVMAVCAMAITAAALIGLVIVPVCGSLVVSMTEGAGQVLEPLAVLVTTAGVGACLIWLLAEFVMMCARVKKETAFTPANVRALGRIVLAFVLGGLFLLPLGKPMMDWLLLGMRGMRSAIWWLLPSFAAWAAALLVRAIQVLMKRAVEMQSEQDLTV